MAEPSVIEREQAEVDKAFKEAPAEVRETTEKPGKRKVLTSNAPPKPKEAEVDTEDTQEDTSEGEDTSRRNTRQVPLNELLTERKKRQERESQIEKLQREYQDNILSMNKRILESLPPPPPPKPEEDPLPNIDEDPYNHLLKRTERAEKALQQSTQWRSNLESQANQQRTVQQIAEVIAKSEQDFTTTTPDYPDSRAHLLDQWTQEAKMVGADENITRQYVEQETMKILQAAAQFNKSPAELVYMMAKLRGYATKDATTDEYEEEQSIPVRTQLPNNPMLDNIRKGQEKSRVPANAKPSVPPSIQNLLDLDDDEFLAATKGKKWEKMFS